MSESINQFLKDLFGLTNFEIRELHGYANRNYLVQCGSDRYILKTYSDAGLLDALKGENAMLLRLQDSDSRVPHPIAGTDGKYIYHSGIKLLPHEPIIKDSQVRAYAHCEQAERADITY